MDFQRHDSLTSRLGERNDRPYWRLWLEDAGYARLQRNGFLAGGRFDVARRPGTGLVIEESLMGSFRITPHRSGCVLSYEARDLGTFLGTPDVRVRVSVRKILVMPLLRVHSVAVSAPHEVWAVNGCLLTTPTRTVDIRTPAPLNLRRTATSIEATLDETNLVYATELIGNQRPGRVVINGAPLMLTIGGQFLRACGYGETSTPGEFVR